MSVFEVGEIERGAGDVADFAGACGVRSNRQRLNAEVARLNRQRSTTRYVTVQTSTIALHTAYSHVEATARAVNARGQELPDLAEAEMANSVQVANAFLDETVADAGDRGTSLTDELSALSEDLHNRWEGTRFVINPRNPDAARHFCTSARGHGGTDQHGGSHGA